ncbi:MAG TPA: aminomethyltransferase family protein [Planctomycetota bacterium]
MPAPTPFHARTFPACSSLLYKEWAGCYAVKRYDVYVDREYYAVRHQATVMDATPLYKYEVRGQDAARLLARVMVRGFERFAIGRVGYVCWCDEHGKVLDDGTVTRLGDEHFRVTAADPALAWLERQTRGLRVSITDSSRTLAALALQGPRARDVLRALIGKPADELKFFRALVTRLPGRAAELAVTRTGYTGDLGYELWVANEHALALWDALFEAGAPHGLLPMGLDALDVARVEAGFLLGGVDYTSARRAPIERQKSTPFELGFDWMVELEREPFLGQAALARARKEGPARRFVGLEIDWEDFERIYERYGLPPHLETGTSREGVPLFRGGRQVGYATSRSWSPLLKRYLALGTVEADLAAPDNELEIEVTCEYERHRARARVTKLPFFDPERKKA